MQRPPAPAVELEDGQRAGVQVDVVAQSAGANRSALLGRVGSHRMKAPGANTNVAATLSLVLLCCERLTNRTLPWSSVFTMATAKLAVNKSRDAGSTDMPSCKTSLRKSRMSAAASLHLVTLGDTGQGGIASCRSSMRKRSLRMTLGRPQSLAGHQDQLFSGPTLRLLRRSPGRA